jgi:glycosyltransferase involved in cell wall biosynthesis
MKHEKPRILFFVADVHGCGHARCMIPTYALMQTNKYDCQVSMLIDPAKHLWNPDVVMISRQHKPEVKSHILRFKEAGARIVFDCDDLLSAIYPSNPAYKAFQKIKGEVTDIMNVFYVLTVSTQPLADAYKHVNNNIIVLPNQILPTYAKLRTRNVSNKVRIGWAGSNTHQDDFSEAEDGIVKVGMKRDDVKFVFFGYMAPRIKQAFSDDKGSLLSDKVEYHHQVPIDKYHMKLGLLSLDIGLAPLSDNKFNASKSNLKVLEYGVMGIPTIASKVYPYEHTIEQNHDGILIKKRRHWEARLNELIDDTKARKLMGQRIQEKVLTEFNIFNNIHLWEHAYFA